MATNTRVMPGGASGTAVRRSQGVWRDAFGRLRKNKLAMVGLVAVILLYSLAILGPSLASLVYRARKWHRTPWQPRLR